MKLPDFTDDISLNELRQAMGAPRREFTPPESPGHITVEEIEKLAREGIEIPLDQVRILDDQTLAYKDRRVVLYIRDVKQYRYATPTDAELPRFHIANCETLREMRAKNRYQRYVVATRDTGMFQINFKPQNSKTFQSSEKELKVCQNCLGTINWNGFSQQRHLKSGERSTIVSSFSLREFFQRLGKILIGDMPDHTEVGAPLNDYTKEFAAISKRLKEKRNYRCDKCRRDFSAHKQYLQAHHLNGLQYDDRESNISILCLADHANQPNHSHMKSDPKFKEFMRLLQNGVFDQ